jgi:hypothetical protein
LQNRLFCLCRLPVSFYCQVSDTGSVGWASSSFCFCQIISILFSASF